jgi:hypothetical protein
LTAGLSKVLTLENEKKTVFLLHFTHLIDFDSKAVEDTSVRENSKFFWISAHLIVSLQAKDGENRHQLSEVEQDIECWE